MNWRLRMFAALLSAAAAAIVFWVLNARLVDHWLAVHTGTINESGPYYGFWSGFGSDLTEFGVIGVLATGIYQLGRGTTATNRAAGASARTLPPVVSSTSAIATIQTSKDRSRRTS
jgi:hypothetical protein